MTKKVNKKYTLTCISIKKIYIDLITFIFIATIIIDL